MGFDFTLIAPLLPSHGGFSSVLGRGVSSLVKSSVFLSMIVQQPVVILVFSPEGVRARPSTLPFWLISYLFIYLFIYFMDVLGLRFCARAFSSCGKWGPHSSSRCAGLSLSRPLLLRSTSSRCAGSVIVAHRPSYSMACGIFPDQGLNPCPLHWQADSQPLRHQGSPLMWL